ncbi:hypothetical protein J3458_008871 [Metarhizium acridum]|uniref:uncharacterized protein n=1 Tax=Metarhizium acridum TaxID=92637 RepID=UPI001C6B8550|nr:hypothetical protein J3458_008871 [Metarhizium acridum]
MKPPEVRPACDAMGNLGTVRTGPSQGLTSNCDTTTLVAHIFGMLGIRQRGVRRQLTILLQSQHHPYVPDLDHPGSYSSHVTLRQSPPTALADPNESAGTLKIVCMDCPPCLFEISAAILRMTKMFEVPAGSL